MKKQLFVSRIHGAYTPKNKYQKALLSTIGQFDRLVVDDPEKFISSMNNWLRVVRSSYPRCAALEVDMWSKPDESNDGHYKIADLIHFELRRLNGRFSEAGPQPFIPNLA